MPPENFDIWLGIDVGKTDHWATALNVAGKKIYCGKLPNDEAQLRQIYSNLTAQGNLLVIVDQPATIGALAVGLAQAMNIMVAYLPGLTMRRVANLYPGKAKTDQRDAFIIADAARTMTHTLRTLRCVDKNDAELGMLTGFDDDLARQITQTRNRIRGLFTHIHPGLERVIGPRLDHPTILATLQTWPIPTALAKAGRARINAKLNKHGARRHHAWADEMMEALATQTVTVTGTNAAALASYAGLAPQTRQSGVSIKSDTVSHAGNKRLKRAFFLSAFAPLRSEPTSRRYYDKKRLAGKRHNQVLIALAHKRSAVLYAMLRDAALYETQPVKLAT
ncbi:IS110 family transposase [Trueperella pyogenes]|uniref:IS110 family transposase n=1 Tax=Trueperella pyogenes TaxID=1661 RepID=UPI00345DE3D6